MISQLKNSLRVNAVSCVRSLLMLGFLVSISPIDSSFNCHFLPGASAESEASSEAASEAPMTGGRRRGYWRYQMQQQRMAAQQARMQQQMQNRQHQHSGLGARQKPFKVSDYIHEYGSGRSKGHFRNLNSANNYNGVTSLPTAPHQTAGGGTSLGNLPSTSSVPFQKFPPK